MKLIYYRFLIACAGYLCMIDPLQNEYLLTFIIVLLILSFVKFNLILNFRDILLALIFVLFIYILGENFNYISTSAGAYFLVFVYLSAASLRKYIDHKFLLEINAIEIFKNFVLIISIINIIILTIYPGATSYLNNIEVFDYYNYPRWLYYFLLNTTANFSIILFTILYLKYKKMNKSSITLFFIVLILVLLASKTTALIIFLVSSLFLFRKQNVFHVFFYILIAAFILQIFITEYSITRLNFYNLSNYDEELSRIFLAKKSLISFMENPFIGIGFDRVEFRSITELLYSSEIGHHSHLLDILGRFGLLGLSFFYFLDIKSWRLLSGIPLIMLITYSIVNNLIDFSFIFLSLIFFKLFNHLNDKDPSFSS